MVSSSDPRSFMYYRGQYYINGTIIEVKDSYLNANKFDGKSIWKYARFDHKVSGQDGILYFFCIANIDTLSLRKMNMDRVNVKEYAAYFTVPAWIIENVVESIVKPIKLSQAECDAIHDGLLNAIEKQQSDWERPILQIAWVAYVIVLIASLIFRQFYILWIIASFIFFKFRKEVLRQ